MSWTNVSKPGAQTWTDINTVRPTYDEASMIYDDPGTYYDGVNSAAYTNVSKPGAQSYTNVSKPT